MVPNADLMAAAGSAPRMAAARRRGLLVRDHWLARDDVARLAALLSNTDAAFEADPAAFADRLRPWLSDHGWLSALIEAAVAAVAEDPFTALPFAPMRGVAAHGLALIRTPAAEASLCWVDAAALARIEDDTVSFANAVSVIHTIRAGGLVVADYGLTNGPIQRLTLQGERRLADGETLAFDNRTSSLIMCAGDSDAVLLRIAARVSDDAPHRHFSRTNGEEIRRSMADDRVSRMMPLLSLARLAGTPARAAPVLKSLTVHGEPQLRWAAMREWLVADRPSAAQVLPTMAAGDADGEVRKAAAATLAMICGVREAQKCQVSI